MARLALSFLGPFAVTLDGVTVTAFHWNKVRALLAYLAVEADGPHPREFLAGLLWPDYPERAARTNLRSTLSNLRTAIGDRDADVPHLVVSRETIQFNTASDCEIDMATFDTLAERGEWEKAAALYRSPFLEGFSLSDSPAFEQWALVVRERLERQMMAVLEGWIAACQGQRDYPQAITVARRQLEIEPWHESTHRALMRALTLNGEHASALAQYEACARILKKELDVAPSTETRELYESIRDGEALPGTGYLAGTRSLHNLPVQLTPFVGREALLREIGARLLDPGCRLLTLVGPGGSGKTRLALEAAARQVERYAHGVWFVPLAPLRAVESIVPTIAGSLGFTLHGGAEPKAQLLDYLRGKHLLLVLDNAEHLIWEPLAGVAGIATEILKVAPRVQVLVTSRAGLNVRGEHRYPIEGMDYPEPAPSTALATIAGLICESGSEGGCDAARFGAIELFLEGARRAQPDFELRDEMVPDVARICQLVEGMPLGILLAAAWVALLTPAEIAAEIGHSLDFLESDERDVPDRQRSLRAAFDHSWHLLSEREQETFAALSVFRGSFTREAAQGVASASPRELLALIVKSLLHRAAEGRYEVHELLRQYAAEQLATSPEEEWAVRDRHASYYAAALERWASDLKSSRQQTALADIDMEIEDARAAWDWAVEHRQVELLAQATEGLGFFCNWRGRYEEGEAAFRTATDALSTAGPGRSTVRFAWQRTLARLLTWQSLSSTNSGYTEAAWNLSRQSLALLEECERAGHDVCLEKAFSLCAAGVWAFRCSDQREARLLLEQSLDLYRARDAHWETAGVLSWFAAALQALGLYEQSAQARREALAIHRELGDQLGIADSLAELGYVLLDQGDLAEAERLIREGLALSRPLSNPVASAEKESDLGTILLWQGRFAEAYPCSEAALAAANAMASNPAQAIRALETLNEIELHLGQYAQARRKAQAALARVRDGDYGWAIGNALFHLGLTAMAEGAYVEAQQRLQESLDQFQRTQTPAQVIQAHAALAGVALLQDELRVGQMYLLEALALLSQYRSFVAALFSLPCVALLLAKRGQAEQAAEVYALAERYPYVSNSRFWEDVVGKHVAAAAATLPAEIVAAAQERGRARELWATVEGLLAKLKEMESECR